MNNHEDLIPGERLEQAAAGMRDAHAEATPTEELLLATIARVGAGEIQAGSKSKGWWTMRVVRRTAVAAGLVVAVGLGVVLVPWGGGSRVAFADVIEQVRQVQAMKCRMALDVEVPGESRQKTEMDVLMTASGAVVVTSPDMKIIMNRKEGRMLTLIPAKKEAMLLDIQTDKKPGDVHDTNGAPNLLKLFRDMTPEGSTALEEKEINGAKARGFRNQKDGAIVEVWADTKTEKPVLVTIAVDNPRLPGAIYTFSGFDWSPAIEEAETSLAIPEGYHVANSTLNMSALAERDVVDMLVRLAEFNGGMLPDHVDMQTAMSLAGRWGGTHYAGKSASEMQQDLMMKMVPVGRAWAYMADRKVGGRWHYDGAGAKIGQKDRAVLWYMMPAGNDAARWRVIDADLSVHEQPEAPTGGEEVVIDVRAMTGVPGDKPETPATHPMP